MDRHCHGALSPRGVKVMEVGWSSVALLWDPVRLRKPSNPLELMGRVKLSLQVSSVWASFCLCSCDLAGGVGLCDSRYHCSYTVVWHSICTGAGEFWQGCCRCQSGLAPHPSYSSWDKQGNNVGPWGPTSHPHSC